MTGRTPSGRRLATGASTESRRSGPGGRTTAPATTGREQQKQSGTQTSAQGSFAAAGTAPRSVVAEGAPKPEESHAVSATRSAQITVSSRQAATRRATEKPRRATRLRFIAGHDSTGAVAAADQAFLDWHVQGR